MSVGRGKEGVEEHGRVYVWREGVGEGGGGEGREVGGRASPTGE